MTVVFAIVVAIYLGAKKRVEEPPTPPSGPVLKSSKRVVVAATDLMPRTLLTNEMLEEREVPSAPEGVFSSEDEAIYRLTLTFIRRGEPIFRQHVTPPLKETSAAYLIPPGQVGMALTVSRPETGAAVARRRLHQHSCRFRWDESADNCPKGDGFGCQQSSR